MRDVPMLYWGSGSPPCWRVMITLSEKNIRYNNKLLSMDKNEHKGPEVMAINPRGQVPSMKIGDIAINDSVAACDFLEDQHKNQGTALIPSNPKEKALVMQRKFEALNLHRLAIEQTLFYMFREDKQKEEIESRMKATRSELGIWDGYMKTTGTGAHAAGKNFTQADIILFPSLAFLVRMGLRFNPRFPHLDDYYKRVSERPSVKSSWPPHWKQSPDKDLLKDL